MALTSNSTNRFGPTSYIVGTTLGNGCNFITIQSAITQAVSDGFNAANPCTILVRPGTYSSFIMAPGIQVEGVCAGGVLSNSAAVVGNVTIDASAAGGVFYALKNLRISDPADALSTINAGPAIFVDIANCSLNGDRGIVLSNISGTFSIFNIRECRIVGTTTALSIQEHNNVFAKDCTIQGASGVVIRDTGRLLISESTVDARTTYAFLLTNANRLDIRNCSITSVEESIFGNGTDVVELYHSNIESTAASGNFIDLVGTFEFYDVSLTGTALLNNAVATNYIDWQPHAGTAANATLPGGVRGTSCFSSTDFSVTSGFVELSASALGTYPVDNGVPGVPLAGAMSFLGSTSTDFPNPSGIETHVGATTNEIYLEDRRWTSSLIVDPDATVGLRGTFTTITAALAAAVPLQTIYVRPGIYTESFTLVDQVNIVGLTTPSGGLNGIASSYVLIDGTITSAGGSSTIQNLRINPAAGTAIDLTVGGTIVHVMGCTVSSSAAAVNLRDGFIYIDNSYVTGGVNGLEFSAVAGGVATIRNSRVDSGGNAILLSVVGQLTVENSEITSNGAAGIFDSAGGTITLSRSKIEATGSAALDMQIAGTADISYCTLISPIQTINFNAVPPVVTSYHNTHICTGVASEYVVGPGAYTYADDVVSPITFAGIDNATVKTILGWRPWATVAGSPGTNSDKGNASFDSAQFTSTDGFIQLSGGNSPVFTDVSGVLSAVRNNGYYATAATTFTLDSLALQGDLVIIYADTAAAVVVTANAGQQIRVGSLITAVAGTATSTAIGDSLTLRFRAVTNCWETVASMGNWTIV